MDTADQRNRPVVLESGSAEQSPSRRRPRRRTVLGVTAAAVLSTGGVAAGSWSVWFTVDATAPAGNHAPLWFSPPGPTTTTPEPTSGSSGSGRG